MNGHVSPEPTFDDSLRPELLDVFAPSPDFLKRLVESEAIVLEDKSSVLNACLVRAAGAGNADLLECLLQLSDLTSADSADTDGAPALCLATSLRHGECVRLLVEAGCNVNATDPVGWTALHWAVAGNDAPLAAFLLNRGARLEAKSLKGLDPADLVVHGEHGSTMREILDFAAERTLPTSKRSFAKGKQKAVDEAQLERIRKRLEVAREAAQSLDGLDLDSLGLDEVATDGVGEPFDWSHCEYDQMLVFSARDIPAIVTVLVDEAIIRPSNTAADMLYLCIRYAGCAGPDGLIDRLVAAALSGIDDAVQAAPNNIALSTYWLSNMLTLLYYLRKDVQISPITGRPADPEPLFDFDNEAEVVSVQDQLEFLIQELLVRILRVAEHRLEMVIDAGMLDYESLPLEEPRFEGEWRMPRAFSMGRGRRESAQGSIFALFGNESPNPENGLRKGQSLTNLREPPSPSSSTASPRTVTSILSALIFVLQQFRLPTFIVLQALSQLIYWISAELFNHVITSKRYLCRSKAMQIRLNASSLEDWARLNFLPTRLISRPFEPLKALLQWLQCLSSEQTVPDLLRTLDQMRPLNPLQMLRAVQDYRYEVDEAHMADKCLQHLSQMQAEYERNRLRESQSRRQDDSHEFSFDAREQKNTTVMLHLDALFGSGGDGPASYEPPDGPECYGELLETTYMLPFALPASTYLLAPRSGEHTFGPLPGSVQPAAVETAPSPPDGILSAFDEAAARGAAAKAIARFNAASTSPDLTRSLRAWRARVAS